MKVKRHGLLMLAITVMASVACLASFPLDGGYGTEPQRFDRSERLADLAVDLERKAVEIIEDVNSRFFDRNLSYDRNRTWADDQVEILFAAETFASSTRVFRRLAEGDRSFDSRMAVRQGMERAYRILFRDFENIDAAARRGRLSTYALSDCRDLLRRIDREIGPGGVRPNDPITPNQLGQDNWIGRYVKGPGSSVFLIERRADGAFVKQPFNNLESLFKYNYDQDRGENPWGYMADVSAAELSRMRTGNPIERTFEGQMIIETGTSTNRSVYFIQGGKKRGLTKPELVARYGGWKKVFQVPRDIINGYPDGEPIY